jgi:NAD(P)H-flavin reductase
MTAIISPLTEAKQKGFFEAQFRCYEQTKQFPTGGKMGRFLRSLEVGHEVVMDGPLGHYAYEGNGVFQL